MTELRTDTERLLNCLQTLGEVERDSVGKPAPG